ncbi:MAG TPA: hypothetical protein VER57_02020 [Cyanobium sp.]|nr:hypothetical protein [Cyanobium sp.]
MPEVHGKGPAASASSVRPAAEEGLEALSGLALAHDRRSLWVVGDETARLFRVDLDGRLDSDATIEHLDEDIEGISLDPGGAFL